MAAGRACPYADRGTAALDLSAAGTARDPVRHWRRGRIDRKCARDPPRVRSRLVHGRHAVGCQVDGVRLLAQAFGDQARGIGLIFDQDSEPLSGL
jgi:hypothetical protein